MHQANWSDWAHLVSKDLVHWTRIQSALSPNGDWDGALTIVDGKPIIMYDCFNTMDCRPPSANATAGPLGDPAIVGLARPVNYSDANLTEWTKDPANPIVIHGAGRYAGPSTLWRDEDGEMKMAMPLNGAIGLFRTSDSSLHTWNLTTAAFYPNSSGPSEFFALPGIPSSRAPPGGAQVTHVLGGIAPPKPHRIGTAWYTLGKYNPVSGTFSNTTEPAPFDGSEIVLFSQLHVDDGRMLFMGWYNPCDSAACHGALTVPREVTFDPETTSLRSLPAPELAVLRGAVLGGPTSTRIASGKALGLLDRGSTAYDLVLNVTLPPQAGVRFALAVMAATPDDASATLQLNVSSPSLSGIRVVVLTGNAAGFASMVFKIPDMGKMPVRILADRTLAEVFIADGRGVVTLPVVATRGNNTFIAAGVSVLEVESTAWEMGCGWASYP